MTDMRLLYVTTKDTEQARMIARVLLDRRLIACANILPHMESIYRWEGDIQNDHEAVLILKTAVQLIEAVTDAILELHSYKTPCVLSLVIDAGAEGYLDWLKSETKQAAPKSLT